MKNLTGLSIDKKVDEIIKAVNTMQTEERINTKLPIGTMILRRNATDNAGINYGKWIALDDKITTKEGILIIYARVE